MTKSIRKYRKSHEYDVVGDPEKASAYDIHDGKGTAHGGDDLLTSPREFIALEELAPGESSPLQTVMLLVASCVGATVLVMPYAFLQGGFLMTILMVLFFGLVSYFSSVCLIHLGVANGIYSFQGLAMLAFGGRGAIAVAIAQLVVSCGLVLTYLAIIFQDFPVLLGHALHLDFDANGRPMESTTKHRVASKILADRTTFAELFAFIILIPFCLFLYSYKKLQHSALVMTFLLLITSLCVVGKARSYHESNTATASRGFDTDYLAVPTTLFKTFGILSAQFAFQHHSFHVFYALRDRSIDKFARVSLFAMLLVLYLVYTFGIGGYVSFLKDTKSDVTQNYDFGEDRSMLPFWILVPVCAMICIPLEMVASRYTALRLTRAAPPIPGQEEVLFRTQPSARQYASTTESDSTTPSQSMPLEGRGDSYTRIHIAITFVLLVILVQIVAFSPSLHIGTVLSVTGGLAGTMLIFVLPAACYLKLTASDQHHGGDTGLVTKCLPWTSIVIGVVGAIACVIANIAQA